MTLGPLMVDVAGTALTAEDREVLGHPLVGSVILFTRNYADPLQLQSLVTEIRGVRKSPLLVAVDHEGGRVQRFRPGFTVLPAVRRIGQAWDQDHRQGLSVARELGFLMAAELRAVGIDFSFAPCVDLDYGVSEIIGDRAFHRRPQAVGELAVAYAHGMRDAGMAATAKHFPGHGAVVADSHLALPTDQRALPDLVGDMIPYRTLIANDLAAVMMAHVLFPQVDSLPASFSRRWIQDILRGELGFQGTVFADDLTMKGAVVVGDIVQRARVALAAGCDILPVCNDRPAVWQLLKQLQVDVSPASALRVLRMRGREVAGVATGSRELLAQDSRYQQALRTREAMA
jgi:beta-N-acetylhexosaminidase